MTQMVTGLGAAFIMAVLATRLVERWGRRREWLDIPNDRSSHEVPTPRIGGIGIAAGTLVGVSVLEGAPDSPLSVILVAGLLLGGVGLVDDLRGTTVLVKYLAQLTAAAAVTLTLQPRLSVDLLGLELLVDGPAAIILGTVWLTAIVNAFNFMDGIDGLVGGVVVVVGLVSSAFTDPAVAPVALAAAAASAGFLVWNTGPASIFMGDVGSQFVGLVVGSALLGSATGTVDVVPALLITSPLVFDTGFTILRRARSGRNILAAHREHLYQRLVTAGHSHREVAAGYVVASIVGGVLALRWSELETTAQAMILLVGAIVAAVYVRWVATEDRRGAPTPVP